MSSYHSSVNDSMREHLALLMYNDGRVGEAPSLGHTIEQKRQLLLALNGQPATSAPTMPVVNQRLGLDDYERFSALERASHATLLGLGDAGRDSLLLSTSPHLSLPERDVVMGTGVDIAGRPFSHTASLSHSTLADGATSFSAGPQDSANSHIQPPSMTTTRHHLQRPENRDWDPSPTAASTLEHLRSHLRLQQQQEQYEQLQQQQRSVQQLLLGSSFPERQAFLSGNSMALQGSAQLPQAAYGLSSNDLLRNHASMWNANDSNGSSLLAQLSMIAMPTTAPAVPPRFSPDAAMGPLQRVDAGPRSPLPTPRALDKAPVIHFPRTLSHPLDENVLSDHQMYLRQQMEVFVATEADVHTRVRGRNKRIHVGQVGIRCRHCVHLPIAQRQLGSAYFPISLMGFYQAAQNMCCTHLQCGKCSGLSDEVKAEFSRLLALKSLTSNAGRKYWAEQLADLGLVDTEQGVYVLRELPHGAQVIPLGSGSRAKGERRYTAASMKSKNVVVSTAADWNKKISNQGVSVKK